MVEMLIAKILYHEKLGKKRKLKCVECGLSYFKRDYKILFDAFKLKYFKINSTEVELKATDPDIIVCHNCLFSILKDLSKKSNNPSEIRFKILTSLSEIELQFNPNQFPHLQKGTNMDDLLAGLDDLDTRDTDDTREGDTCEDEDEDGNPDWGV